MLIRAMAKPERIQSSLADAAGIELSPRLREKLNQPPLLQAANMKFALICAVVLAVCVIGPQCGVEAGPATEKAATTPAAKSGVTASKDLKEAIKNAKEAKKAKKDCLKACPANYDPICAHDPANASFKPRSFGNQCVLDTHNCEMGTKLVVKSKGECPGSDGVRL